MKAKSDVISHVLIPELKKLNDQEKAKILEKYHLSLNNLPRILKKDSGISHLKINEGDVIKITRKSPTAGIIDFYRVVVNE